jgi:hypothetical protein
MDLEEREELHARISRLEWRLEELDASVTDLRISLRALERQLLDDREAEAED